jgi:hypothetical protein
MDAFELEQARKTTIDKLNLSKSPRQILYVLNVYFDLILSKNNSLFISSFLVEFIEDYINAVKVFSPCYTSPDFTAGILSQAETIAGHPSLKEYKDIIKSEIERITQKQNKLLSALNGETGSDASSRGVFFPLLEDTAHLQNKIELGLAETASITIKHLKNAGNDNFVIVPSPEIIEKNLLEQIKISWQLALKYAARYIRKPAEFHEVIIQFNSRSGEYVGESLGAAITLIFLEELLRFYNSPYHITPALKLAVTGGISTDGLLKPVSENIIKQKADALFYSDIETFVVPSGEIHFVRDKLDHLQESFPKRRLNTLEAAHFNDIINRRDLVNITKDNIAVRSGRIIARNYATLLIILIIVSIFSYFLWIRFDDNPAILVREGRILHVENSHGRVLYSKSYDYEENDSNIPSITRNYQLLADINGDGKKELISAMESPENANSKINTNGITCYDHRGERIWSYTFRDTISSPGEKLSRNYSCYLIDTSSINNQKVLVAYSQNHESFGSAIFMLDLKTGHRTDGTFWHPGYILGGYIIDSNGKKEIAFGGINNSYNYFYQNVVGLLDLNDISGKAPSDNYHSFYGQKDADLIKYVRLPKFDYQNIIAPVQSSFWDKGDFQYDKRTNVFTCNIDLKRQRIGAVDYIFSADLRLINIVVNDNFIRARDLYVKEGRLKPPYSGTKAYKDLLRSQLLYWTDGKWVANTAGR